MINHLFAYYYLGVGGPRLEVLASLALSVYWLRQYKARINPELFHADYLLIVGKTSHDSWVHNPIHQHGEGIDGEVGVGDMSLHHAAELLIGQLHRFYGVLQWTDLHLYSTGREGFIDGPQQ